MLSAFHLATLHGAYSLGLTSIQYGKIIYVLIVQILIKNGL